MCFWGKRRLGVRLRPDSYPVTIYVFLRLREDWGVRLRCARGVMGRDEEKIASLFFRSTLKKISIHQTGVDRLMIRTQSKG